MKSGRVSLWHTDGRGLIWTSTGLCEGEVECIDISSDNKLVASCSTGDESSMLLDGGSGETKLDLSGHTCDVRCVIFTRGGKYYCSTLHPIPGWERRCLLAGH